MPKIIIVDEERPQQSRSGLEAVGCLVVGGLSFIGLSVLVFFVLAVLFGD
jgi:hypothetical protein